MTVRPTGRNDHLCTFAHIALPRLNRRITLVKPLKTVVRPRNPTENSAGEGEEFDASRTYMLPHLMTTLDQSKVARRSVFTRHARCGGASDFGRRAHSYLGTLRSGLIINFTSV